MQAITTIGIDIAKSVFQVHGIDVKGNVLIRRKLKRRYVLAFFQKLQPCLVGIEACATSHHWSRELKTFGDTVRLMPLAYVKPYVKRQRTPTPRQSARRSHEPTCGCRDQDARAAELSNAPSHPPTLHPPADSMPSGPTWPSSALLRRLAAKAWNNYLPSPPTLVTTRASAKSSRKN
jgi:transposase